MANRNSAETPVPISAADVLAALKTGLQSRRRSMAISHAKATTMVEWPSEKKKPTATGRLPSCISLRVTLSMAEMWSASKA